MKTNQSQNELLTTTTSSEEIKIISDETSLAEVYTPDFRGQFNVAERALDNHSAFDELVQQWEQDEPEKLSEARHWVADQFYTDEEETIKTIRLKKGLSQAQLADLMGTKQPYISRIEKGTENFMLSTMRELSTALEIDMNTLERAIAAQEKLNHQKIK